MLTSGVYAIENTVNGKTYIGSAVSLANRKRGHLGDLRRGVHSNRHLQNAFDKHGEEVFGFIVLAYCDPRDRLALEQAFIDGLRPEYNVALVAGAPMSGRKHTEETKRRIGAAFKGRRHTEETRSRISAAHKGKTFSEETRRKMSAAKKGKDPSPLAREHLREMIAANEGKTHTEETKARMSAAAMGNTRALGCKRSEETRRKIGEASTGRRHTDETKAKCGAANKGNTYWVGRKHTAESKRKISEARRQREAQ